MKSTHPPFVYDGKVMWRYRPALIRNALIILWKAINGWMISGIFHTQPTSIPVNRR